jgi:hypothetical protein
METLTMEKMWTRPKGKGRAAQGPSLPFKLRKEVEVTEAGAGQSRRRGSMFKVSQRKEQRKAARKLGRRPLKASVPRAAQNEEQVNHKCVFLETYFCIFSCLNMIKFRYPVRPHPLIPVPGPGVHQAS